MLIILERTKELVVLVELGVSRSSLLGHVKVAVIDLLCPESDWLLLRVVTLWQQFLQLFVRGYLLSGVKSVIGLQVLIYVLERHRFATLVLHHPPPDSVLCNVMFYEDVFVGGLEFPALGLRELFLGLLGKLSLHLVEVHFLKQLLLPTQSIKGISLVRPLTIEIVFCATVLLLPLVSHQAVGSIVWLGTLQPKVVGIIIQQGLVHLRNVRKGVSSALTLVFS